MAIIQATVKLHIQACSPRKLESGESYSIILADEESVAKLKLAGLIAHDEATAKEDIDAKYLSKTGVEFACFASHEKQLEVSVDKISEVEDGIIGLPK